MRCEWSMSSGLFGAMDGDGPVKCRKDAIWKGLCEEHGGKFPSIEQLMHLLGMLTKWGTSSTNVSFCLYEVREMVAQDESRLTGVWQYGAVTNICGMEKEGRVEGHGPTLEHALWNLCEKIPQKYKDGVQWRIDQEKTARAAIAKFLET